MCETVFYPTIDLYKTGQKIEYLRKERGISVKEMQVYFGFENPQAIYKWQWGKSLPSVDNLFALARLLGVPMQEILVETSDQDVVVYGAFLQKENGRLSVYTLWRPFFPAGPQGASAVRGRIPPPSPRGECEAPGRRGRR